MIPVKDLAPVENSPRPELSGVLVGVCRFEGGGHSNVAVDRLPGLQPVRENWLAVGTANDLEERETRFIRELEAALVVRLRQRPRIKRERFEHAGLIFTVNEIFILYTNSIVR